MGLLLEFRFVASIERSAQRHLGRKISYISSLQIWLGLEYVALRLIKNNRARIPWRWRIILHVVLNSHGFFLTWGRFDQNLVFRIHETEIFFFSYLRWLLIISFLVNFFAQVDSFLHSGPLLIPFHIDTLEEFFEFLTIVKRCALSGHGLHIFPGIRVVWILFGLHRKSTIRFIPQLFLFVPFPFIFMGVVETWMELFIPVFCNTLLKRRTTGWYQFRLPKLYVSWRY